MNTQTLKDINRAFKALEERDTLLDNIMVDIEKITNTVFVKHNRYVSLIDVRQIINNYKLKEGEESNE